MRANSLPLTSAIAAVVAASALVLAPAEVARPTPLGHVCVVMGPRTTCRSTGDVEIHRTSTPVVGFPHDGSLLLGGGPRILGDRY
jgi:hypothetical protein